MPQGYMMHQIMPSSVVSAELVKKYRFDERTIAKLLEKEWWNGDEEKIEKVKEFECRVNEYLS